MVLPSRSLPTLVGITLLALLLFAFQGLFDIVRSRILVRQGRYTAAQMGKVEEGIAGLEWFVARHPADVRGHYQLGMAQRSLDSSKALAQVPRTPAKIPFQQTGYLSDDRCSAVTGNHTSDQERTP